MEGEDVEANRQKKQRVSKGSLRRVVKVKERRPQGRGRTVVVLQWREVFDGSLSSELM